MSEEFIVGVFVERGKRSWRFSAYTRDWRPEWDGCNAITVQADSGTDAKAKAIAHIKARMNPNSRLAPSDVNVVGETPDCTKARWS